MNFSKVLIPAVRNVDFSIVDAMRQNEQNPSHAIGTGGVFSVTAPAVLTTRRKSPSMRRRSALLTHWAESRFRRGTGEAGQKEFADSEPGDLVDVVGNGAQELDHLRNVSHVQLNHAAIHRHFPQIDPQICRPQKRHSLVDHLGDTLVNRPMVRPSDRLILPFPGSGPYLVQAAPARAVCDREVSEG